MEPFKSIYKGDFLWPYIAPVTLVPSAPPQDPLPKGTYEKGESILDKSLCQCDRHSWSPHFKRAQHLKAKEAAYREAMISVAKERTILENEILEHPCTDSDDVLASLYQLNYDKRAFPVTGYRAMKADHDDPVVTPVAMLRTGTTSGYRDPTDFKSEAIKIPDVTAAAPVTFAPRIPSPDYFKTPKSEYEDTISKVGVMTLRSSQQYTEPLPSSRMRVGCVCTNS